MADPFTIFAAAGNALQFAEVGAKLIRKTIEYAKIGSAKEHRELQDVTQRLIASNAHLEDLLEIEAADITAPGPARALKQANQECLSTSQELVALLGELKLNKSRSVWKSGELRVGHVLVDSDVHGPLLFNLSTHMSAVKLARKSISWMPRIERLERNVSHARSNLAIAFMVYTASKNVAEEHHESLNKAILQKIRGEVQTNVGSRENPPHATNETSDLKSDVEKGQKEEVPFFETAETYSYQEHVLADLSNLSKKMHVLLEQNKPSLTSLLSDMKGLMSIMEREFLVRIRITNSLHFPDMGSRRERVAQPFEGTYDWIFKTVKMDDMVSDNFLQWLGEEENNRVYWICGKPGSGKSTLMRQLADHIILHADKGSWIEGVQLLTASHFFWYAGTIIERSLEGLLRTLTHSLFQQRPSIIQQVVSPNFWNNAHYSDGTCIIYPWTYSELKDVLIKACETLDEDVKILFLIDGLDEQTGDDGDRKELIRLLKDLTTIGKVKLCLSSRPWNIYKDAFETYPRLRLEQLTRKDITHYVHRNLEGDQNFWRVQKRHKNLHKIITTEVVEKAEGVFLWVILVVRDLLKCARDGGRSRDLLQVLRDTPPELDDYFKRMMSSIDPLYRKDASTIMQVALCSLDYSWENRQKEESLHPGPPLLLLDLYFLYEYHKSNFAKEDAFKPLKYRFYGDVLDYEIDVLERRVTSRSMGLLEVHSHGMDPWHKHVYFLHRTVKDFLCLPEAQSTLLEYTSGPFQADAFRLNAIVAHNVSLRNAEPLMESEGFEVLNYLSCFISRAPHFLEDKTRFTLFEKLVSCVQDRARACRPDENTSPIVWEAAEGLVSRESSSLSLAVQLNWISYVVDRLSLDNVVKDGRLLLDYSLRPSLAVPQNPHVEIAELLLKHGVNPNDSVEGHTVWISFLVYISAIKDLNRPACLHILRTLLIHGAARFIPTEDWHSALTEHEAGNQQEGWSTDKALGIQLFKLRSAVCDNGRRTDYYKVTHIIRYLWGSSGKLAALFAPKDLEMLEEAWSLSPWRYHGREEQIIHQPNRVAQGDNNQSHSVTEHYDGSQTGILTNEHSTTDGEFEIEVMMSNISVGEAKHGEINPSQSENDPDFDADIMNENNGPRLRCIDRSQEEKYDQREDCSAEGCIVIAPPNYQPHRRVKDREIALVASV